MLVRKLKFLFLFFISFYIFESSYSLDLNELLAQPLRPTISQVKTLMDAELIFRNPIPDSTIPIRESFEPMAEAIALLEWYYPGAIWAPVGRDAFLTGDILDAFYLSIGQEGRVSRLNCSSSSFGHQPSQSTLYQFLHSAGLDVENLESSPPFILFDNTSYGEQSQSTRLIKSGYEAFSSRWRKQPVDLIRKFNIWSSSTAGLRADQTNPEQFFDYVSKTMGERPMQILNIPQASGYSHGYEWHETFGTFTNYFGKFMGQPGPLQDIAYRKVILYELSMVINGVFNSHFLNLVKEKARYFGYDFPMTRIYSRNDIPEETEEERAKRLIHGLDEVISHLAPPSDEKKYFSNNGYQLVSWLEKISNENHHNALLFYFIQKIVLAKEEGKITRKDFRRILARSIGMLSLPDDEFFYRFIDLYKSSPHLQDVLSRKRDVFVNSNKPDKEQVKKAFLFLETELANSCAISLVEKPLKEESTQEKDNHAT